MTDIASNLPVFLPELILVLGALALLMLGAFAGEKATGAVSALCGGVLVVGAFAAALCPLGTLFDGGFVMDRAAAFSKVAIYLASAAAVVLGQGWLERSKMQRFEFPVLIVLATVGMSMMVSCGDLISLYIGIELQSLALYVLCAFPRDDARASEAGLKYFVLGALSSGFLLYGASLIYGFAGSMRFEDIAHAIQVQTAAHHGVGTGVIFGLVFLICGIAFKVSAAPFHMWTPDVYEGAPTPVVAFVAAAPKLAAMVLFARALSHGFMGALDQWRQVVVAIAVISYLVGAFGGLMQKDLKRLIAYSSIANIGYALLAIAAGTQQGVQSMLMFMVFYIIDVTGFLACLMALSRDGKPITLISQLAGLKRERPGVALAITGISLSLLGMPPFAGFWGKFYVFTAAIHAGLWQVALLGLVSSVVAAFYYLRILKVMWFDPSPSETGRAPAETRWIGFAAAAFGAIGVWIVLRPLDVAAWVAAGSFGLH